MAAKVYTICPRCRKKGFYLTYGYNSQIGVFIVWLIGQIIIYRAETEQDREESDRIRRLHRIRDVCIEITAVINRWYRTTHLAGGVDGWFEKVEGGGFAFKPLEMPLDVAREVQLLLISRDNLWDEYQRDYGNLPTYGFGLEWDFKTMFRKPKQSDAPKQIEVPKPPGKII